MGGTIPKIILASNPTSAAVRLESSLARNAQGSTDHLHVASNAQTATTNRSGTVSSNLSTATNLENFTLLSLQSCIFWRVTFHAHVFLLLPGRTKWSRKSWSSEQEDLWMAIRFQIVSNAIIETCNAVSPSVIYPEIDHTSLFYSLEDHSFQTARHRRGICFWHWFGRFHCSKEGLLPFRIADKSKPGWTHRE